MGETSVLVVASTPHRSEAFEAARYCIDTLKRILMEDSLGICARLDADIQKAVDAYVDPWKEAVLPAYPNQFSAPELAAVLEVAENNG